SALADRAADIFAAQKQPGQIDVDDVLPLLEAGALDALEDGIDTGVVDQHVDLAEPGHRRVAQRHDVRRLRYVSGLNHRPLADRGGGFLQSGARASGPADGRTVAGE